MSAVGARPRVGISACLLGRDVRYDGGHKRHAFLCDELGAHVEWVAVCPEVEAGLGTPREPVSLVQLRGGLRMRGNQSGRDVTDTLLEVADRRLAELETLGLDGFVLKAGSPSCGVARVPILTAGSRRRDGRGLFAARLVAADPALPLTEEGWLASPTRRERFVRLVFAHHRLRLAAAGGGGLPSFHARYARLLAAHSARAERRLRRLVGEVGASPRSAAQDAYRAGVLAALGRPATRARHARVLQGLLAEFAALLASRTRRALDRHVERLTMGEQGLSATRTAFAAALRAAGQGRFVNGDAYFAPLGRVTEAAALGRG